MEREKICIPGKNGYHLGKVGTPPALDVSTGRNHPRLVQLFGQEDVNKKMDELEDGYTNISMPKRQKIVSGVLAGFCVILLIIANSGILPSGEEDAHDESDHSDHSHEDHDENNPENIEAIFNPLNLAILFLLTLSICLYVRALCLVLKRQTKFIEAVFSDWCQHGISVTYFGGSARSEHQDAVPATVEILLPAYRAQEITTITS